jgi:hypothetical protein
VALKLKEKGRNNLIALQGKELNKERTKGGEESYKNLESFDQDYEALKQE